MGQRKLGNQLEGSFQAVNGFMETIELCQVRPQVVPDAGIVGLQCQGLPQRKLRFGKTSLFFQGQPEIVRGMGQLGIQSECLPGRALGLDRAAQSHQNQAQIIMGRRIARGQCQRPLDMVFGLLELAAAISCQPKKPIGLGSVRSDLEDNVTQVVYLVEFALGNHFSSVGQPSSQGMRWVAKTFKLIRCWQTSAHPQAIMIEQNGFEHIQDRFAVLVAKVSNHDLFFIEIHRINVRPAAFLEIMLLQITMILERERGNNPTWFSYRTALMIVCSP